MIHASLHLNHSSKRKRRQFADQLNFHCFVVPFKWFEINNILLMKYKNAENGEKLLKSGRKKNIANWNWMEHESKNCTNKKAYQRTINVEPKMHMNKKQINKQTSMREYRSSKSGNWMVNTDVCYNCAFTKKHAQQLQHSKERKKTNYAYDR